MTTSETLIKARHLIEQGWCQGALFKLSKGKTRYCIAGALREAKYQVDRSPGLAIDCHNAIFAASGIKPTDIAEFNDAPGRKKSQILKLMDDAIELAKRKESEQ